MITVERTAARPPDLDWKRKRETKTEAERAREHFLPDPPGQPKTTPFEFEVYRRAGVSTAINELFQYKCAYCESQYGGMAPVDVEHFRPKGLVVESRRPTRTSPGYWWLASEWSNLLASCIDCNRPREHKFVEGGSRVSGKANWFPLEQGSRRALRPGEEAAEVPLLINPCECDPRRYVTFEIRDAQSIALPAAADEDSLDFRLGDESIKLYGLNRPLLVRLRTEMWKHAAFVASTIAPWRAILATGEPDQREAARNELRRAMAELKSYMVPTAPWSAAMTAHIGAALADQGIRV